MTPSPCPVVPIPCGTRFLWRLPVRLDPFTSVLIVVVALASFFPCEGQVAVWFGLLTKLAVALLFFMHGAKLSRQNLLAGLGHWRLHLVVMASTFLLFPLLGLLLTPLVPQWLSPAIYLGFFVSVRPARHRAVGHRLHLHGGGQCVGGGVQRLGLQHPRHLPLAGAGGADDQCGGGSIPGTPFRPSWCS